MLPLGLEGIWAASQPALLQHRWIPAPPAFSEHYFLAVSKRSDGTLEAFVRNPESNWGASIGTRMLTASGKRVELQASGENEIDGSIDPDGTITFAKMSASETDLTFHRASASDLQWFYPLPADHWTYHEPDETGDGWHRATLHDQGMREAPIVAFMNSIAAERAPQLRSPYIQSLAVARHGRLVLDQYFYGFTAAQPRDVRSAGKSVTTLMVGREATFPCCTTMLENGA